MDLSEIEAATDALLEKLASTTIAGEVRDLCFRLDGMYRGAQIKAAVAKQALFRQAWGGAPEPAKPAVDRLHELVSYGKQMEASNRTVEYPCPDAADAYQDLTSKLEEILKEGTL